jgi:hypothetical protein
MRHIVIRYLGSLCLAAALIAPAASVGCAARATYGVRFYDGNHGDYHSWDDREDRSYRQYLGEKHEDYRDFSKLNHNEQNDYWNWRHSRPDSDSR